MFGIVCIGVYRHWHGLEGRDLECHSSEEYDEVSVTRRKGVNSQEGSGGVGTESPAVEVWVPLNWNVSGLEDHAGVG